MSEAIIVGAILFFASFIQGFAGFGFGLITAPLLLLLYGPAFVVPFSIICALAINLQLTIKSKITFGKIDYIAPLVAGALIGTPIGVYSLLSLNEQVIRLFLSLLLICYSLYSLFVKEIKKELGNKSAFFSGILSGLLGAALSTGGPPVIIWTSLQKWSKEKVRSTLIFFFLISGLIVFIGHTASGLVTGEILRSFLFSIPVIISGSLLGSHFFSNTSQEIFRKIIYTLIIIMGVLIFPYRA